MINGDRLRALREEKELSQGDIEKRTGLLRCYISPVENWVVLGACLAAMSPPLCAQSISLRVDFDGSGFGKIYSSSSSPRVEGRCVSNCGSLGLPSGSNSGADSAQMQSYVASRLEEQRREQEFARLQQELRARRQKNINTIEIVQRIQELGFQLEDTESDKFRREQYNLKYRLLDTVPQFDSRRAELRARQFSLQERLALSIRRIHVPSPVATYDSILILGTFNTPEDAQRAILARAENPFSGRAYDSIFGMGEAGFFAEISRVSLDHFLASTNRLSSSSMNSLGILKGATVREVVAHSNGAKIAEVLIRAGSIRGVKVLRILGGDASLMDLARFDQLAKEKNIKIYVYAVKKDPVPLIPLGWQIREWAEKLHDPIAKFQQAQDLTYEILGLKRNSPPTLARVNVQLLSFPDQKNWVDYHIYATYHRLIQGQRKLGCLDATGSLDSRCRIG